MTSGLRKDNNQLEHPPTRKLLGAGAALSASAPFLPLKHKAC